MISYRQADLRDRFRKRAIYFFNDNRDQIKYYEASTDTLYDPKKDVAVNFTDMFGTAWRMVERAGVVVLIDMTSSTGDALGQPVYQGNDLIGTFKCITTAGDFIVKREGKIDMTFSPTWFVIFKHGNRISVTRAEI